jgi:hypothetical protein
MPPNVPRAVALLLLAVGSASAADREWHRYREIYEKLSLGEFSALEEGQRDRVAVRFRLSPAEGPKAPVTLTIAADAGRIVVAPGPDGLTDFPARGDLLEENPRVLTSVPEGVKTSVQLELAPRLPTGLSFGYADLMRSVEQANRLIRAKAGFFAFAAPRMKGVVLQFPVGAPATARLEGRPEPLATDEQGRLRLPLDDALLARDAQVTLSSRPTSADFLD